MSQDQRAQQDRHFQKWKRSISYADLQETDLTGENNKTVILFVVCLVLMIAAIFLLMGVCMVSLLVYAADDEIQLLHEMAEVDSSIFKHGLTSLVTLGQMAIIAAQIWLSMYLITQEALHEVWFYLRRGILLIDGLICVNAVVGAVITFACIQN